MIPTCRTPTSPPRATPLFVWLPWLCAPAFLLLPIGGCGLAVALRRPALAETVAEPHPRDIEPALVPVRTIVSVVPSAG